MVFDVFKTYLAVKSILLPIMIITNMVVELQQNWKVLLKRPDRYFFHKLSKRYNERDILDYFVSNFAVDGNKWVGNLINNEGKRKLCRFRKYKDAFDYILGTIAYLFVMTVERDILFNDGFLVHNGATS